MKNSMPPDDVAWLRNAIREASIKWPGRAECLRRARRKKLEGYTKKGKPIYKFYWQCAKCGKWQRDELQMEVDHIVEIGSFEGDWNTYLARHFPDPATGLQALCIVCHLKKTAVYNSARTRWSRKSKA
jgi:5-methylcytosine-specific restriction endonuclease McrA